ncbi:hypothetical protein NC652_009044 [Populus alba x Populus x berolinensis]|nr:hypothetical protein NC652_009044 [Populus alba x Populus x berolinensis]
MDVLIALGTNAAYFYSVYSVLRSATSPSFESTDFFETSSMLISFILLGKYLESHVIESMITGEARPVSKRKGDTIVRLVESAQMAIAPVQKFADRISRYFVPLVIILSFSTWLAWFLAGKFHGYPSSWIPKSMDSFQLALQFRKSLLWS